MSFELKFRFGTIIYSIEINLEVQRIVLCV